jgi:type II secretory pathway pseudopilin PulG
MVGIMAGLAIVMILSAVAAQNWADVVRRDNEAEMIFRAQDLVRALKRFQKDQGRLPNELKELGEPGTKGQYFARRIWKDPLVKGGKWQLLYAGPQGGLVDPTLAVPDDDSGLTPPAGEVNPSQLAAGAALPAGAPEITRNDDGTAEVTGLPIAGVKTRCTERPFRLYKDLSEYSQWVFSVFDLDAQQGAAPQAPNPGQPGPLPPRNRGGQPGASFPPR